MATPSEIAAFNAEIKSILGALSLNRGKTLRDESLRERIRTIYRVWLASLRPELHAHAQPRRDVLKIDKDLEVAAKSTSKIHQISSYRERLRSAVNRIDQLAIYVPLTAPTIERPQSTSGSRFLEEITDVPRDLVPNALLGWQENFESFLSKHPFAESVFVMIRYRPRTKRLVDQIRNALKLRGLTAILANEHSITDDMYNPIACLICCAWGIAVFDRPENEQIFNPNVAYELGMFHLLGRPVLILKHSALRSLHTDILSKLYRSFTTGPQVGKLTLEWADSNIHPPAP